MAQFSVYSSNVETIISWIKSGEVAIPEIQRPFVWEPTQVRDLLDSLFKGFPVGYLIIWKNPDVKLKDGRISSGNKIMIDGQQRVTALEAAIAGLEITDKQYKKKKIRIAFNPITTKFEVWNSAIQKNPQWIADISKVFEPGFKHIKFVKDYCKSNQIDGVDDEDIGDAITSLLSIKGINFGVIELSQGLSIDDVTDIFIRINSKGVVLSQADFAMSKISSDDKYGGGATRKMIDYFCHFKQNRSDYNEIIKNDKEFANSPDLKKIQWIKDEYEDIYVPNYTDVLRVSFTHKFRRGKFADLVNLLSGRNFETRENIESIAEDSFYKLREGVESFVNATNFRRFMMIIQSAGIINASLVRSKNALNFGYILYLILKERKINDSKIESIVRRWVVLAMLTGRYSGSAETQFDKDVKKFAVDDPEAFLNGIIKGELSNAFWNTSLVQHLATQSAGSPFLAVYLMAQVKRKARGFLSRQIEVQSLLSERGDIHHIFPKKYLISNGIVNKKDYNQIANYVYTQSEINIKISDNAPRDYMAKMQKQIAGEGKWYGGIEDDKDLKKNLAENCVPEDFINMTYKDYDTFLTKRRRLMAQYIKEYFENLK